MKKFFTDEMVVYDIGNGNIGPGGAWTEDVSNMMGMLVQTNNAIRTLVSDRTQVSNTFSVIYSGKSYLFH